jgi:hypothetical protein
MRPDMLVCGGQCPSFSNTINREICDGLENPISFLQMSMSSEQLS